MIEKETKLFISYARPDAEFALKLAKLLRDSKINLWIDQLDIATGSRWDDEIEKALEESDKVLVILSPSGTKSHNVMDEVSFALDEKKKIIPVLYRNCKIPFRLRRFQYADFTTDFQKGISQLLNDVNIRNIGSDFEKSPLQENKIAPSIGENLNNHNKIDNSILSEKSEDNSTTKKKIKKLLDSGSNSKPFSHEKLKYSHSDTKKDKKSIQGNNKSKSSSILFFFRNIFLRRFLVLCMLFSILAAIAIPNYISYQKKGYDSAAQASAMNFLSLALTFYGDMGVGPSGQVELNNNNLPPGFMRDKDIQIHGSIFQDNQGAIHGTMTFSHIKSNSKYILNGSSGTITKE